MNNGKLNFRKWNLMFKDWKTGLMPLCFVFFISQPQANEKNNASDEWINSLEHQIQQAYRAEIEAIASIQRWENYELDFSVRIPPSASHLSPCEKPVFISIDDNQGLPVGQLKRSVECQSDSPWRILITIRSQISLPVLVAAEKLNREKTLNSADVRLDIRTVRNTEGFFTQIKDIAGFKIRRQLRQGEMLTPRHVEAIPLIIRDEQVLIIAQGNNFRTTTKGIALESGRLGQQVPIRNIKSGKIIYAEITGKGLVNTRF